MKRKHFMKKSLAVWLVLALSVSLLAGCSKKDTPTNGNDTKVSQDDKNNEGDNKEQGNGEEDSEQGTDKETTEDTSKDTADNNEESSDGLTELKLPLTDEKEEIYVWTWYSNSFIDDPNEIASVKEMENRTNVHVKWMPVGSSEITEKFGLMLASDNIPDIVYTAGSVAYPGGIEKGIEEGVFTDCTELVEKYMPNYRALRKSTPELEKDTMTDDGKLACIYGINSNNTNEDIYSPKEWYGLAVRQDMLAEMGITELPETIEEWHTMLTKAKENGVEMPLLTGKNGYSNTAPFLSAYGVLPEFYQENGVVKYGPMEEGYRQWIELFRDWYAEGLIDRNFVSTDAFMSADAVYSTTGKSVAFSVVSFFTGMGYAAMGYTDNMDINVVAVPNPVLNKGEQPMGASSNGSSIRGNEIYLSASSKNPELVAKWLDYQFSIDGMMLNFYGIENETYTIENGEIEFADMILNDPDGMSPNDALLHYAIGNGPMRYNQEYNNYLRKGALYYDEHQDTWTKNDVSKVLPSPMSMTAEEGIEYNNLYTAIKTLVEEYTVKFIMGTESMDNYDSFVEQLKQFGVEKCIAYQQAALDRYNQRGQ